MEKKENKIFGWFRKLPEKKHYLEFIKEFLYVPFLVVIIIANIYALKTKNNPPQPSPTPEASTNLPGSKPDLEKPSTSQNPIVIQFPSSTPAPSPSPGEECKNQPQPAEIVFPAQNQKLENIEPVCIVFSKLGSNYCEQSFSYKVNNGDWTPTGEKTICLYNLPDGEVNFALKVKNETSGQEQTYSRKFTYQKTTASPSPSMIASPNPSISPSPSPAQF